MQKLRPQLARCGSARAAGETSMIDTGEKPTIGPGTWRGVACGSLGVASNAPPRLPARAFSAESIMRINLHRLVLASIAVLGMVCAPRLVSADPAQDAGVQGKVAPLPARYGVVNHIGDVQQQVSLADGKLLAHRRATDPFGVAIRGKFKGLPTLAEHPALPLASRSSPSRHRS